MGMNLEVGEDGFATGWIERGMMGRTRLIFMNMHQVSLCPFVLLLKYSCSFTVFLFWSHFITYYSCFKFPFIHD